MKARLCFIGRTLMENRSGLLVETCLTQAGRHREGSGAGHDRAASRVAASGEARDGSRLRRGRRRERTAHPQREAHVAQNVIWRSAIDCRTTRHASYEASQRVRKRIEETFGWMKSVGRHQAPGAA